MTTRVTAAEGAISSQYSAIANLQNDVAGNRPGAKPEDCARRAIDLEELLRVLAGGIEEQNTRVGRRSEVAFGRCFVSVLDESYA